MSSTSVETTVTANQQPSTEESQEDVTISDIRATKRKLDDAFQSLDDAVTPHQASQRPSPSKKTNVNRTLYSTLAKYGIMGSKASTSKNNLDLPSSITVPHLKAILTRAATRSGKILPWKHSSGTPPPSLPPTAEYRPSSIQAFLSRLSTFKLSTYSQKPASIDAVAAAKCGWINEGKDRLVCGLCKSSWVVIGTKGMSHGAVNTLVEKQKSSLIQQHKDGCPWKVRQCDSNIYRIPLQTPSTMVRDLKANATELDPVLKNVEFKHPLTPSQMKSLRSAILSHDQPSRTAVTTNTDSSSSDDANPFIEESPSNAAIVTSLFGWSIAPPAPPETQRRLSSRPSSGGPRTPTLSRASSVRPSTPTPVPATAPRGPKPTETTTSRPRFPSLTSRIPSTSFSFRVPSGISARASTSTTKRENTLLHCKLCQRRVGLWAFTNLPAPAEPLSASRSGSPARSIAPEDGDTSTADISMADISMDTSVGGTATPPRFSIMESVSAPLLTRASAALAPKQFDPLKEHRSYCPYVVRSTAVPSPPLPRSVTSTDTSSPSFTNKSDEDNALEGWRAVLTLILRYGLGLQYRLGLNYVTPGDLAGAMEVDSVNVMVAAVKNRGGKDLLTYVKGLLG